MNACRRCDELLYQGQRSCHLCGALVTQPRAPFTAGEALAVLASVAVILLALAAFAIVELEADPCGDAPDCVVETGCSDPDDEHPCSLERIEP